jgi:hypothetical protein
MEQEIDFICNDCQQPVYKCPPGAFQAGHRCGEIHGTDYPSPVHTSMRMERKLIWDPPQELLDEVANAGPAVLAAVQDRLLTALLPPCDPFAQVKNVTPNTRPEDQ